MKKAYLIAALISLFVSSLFLYSFSGGITGATRKNGSGCTCHGKSSTSSVIVSIIGPDTVSANDSADYIITITGGPLVRGGTNIAARSGILVPLTGLRIFNGELTHIAPFEPAGSSITIHFRYKAPSTPGKDTIFANGNSVNFNGFSTGDNWNFAPEKIVTIRSSTGIHDQNENINKFDLRQNYPNPFNPSTTINFYLQSAIFTDLKIYSCSGKLVAVLANSSLSSGEHSVQWNAGNAPSGIYFYKLSAGGVTKTMKMILTK